MPSPDDHIVTPRIADLDGTAKGVHLDDWMRQRDRSRWRMARSVLAVAALIITVVVLVRAPWMTPSNAPFSTTFLGDAAIIDTNVTYGTLQVNDATYAVRPWLHVALRQGVNHLTLHAPPFNDIHCTLVAPLTSGDARCIAGYSVQERQGYVEVVSLAVGETDLPASALNGLTPAIKRAMLNFFAQTTLAPGEWFSTGDVATKSGLPILQQVTVPTLAQLSALLEPDAALSCGLSICPITTGNTTLQEPGAFWQIQVPVAPVWRIVDQRTGVSHVYSLPYITSLTGNDETNFTLTLQGVYDGHDWTFSDAAPIVRVHTPTQQLADLACEAGASVLSSKAAGIISFAPGTSSGAGCELIFTNNSAGGNTSPPIAHFIERVGALLAADANAQRVVPGIPLASPSEIGTVHG